MKAGKVAAGSTPAARDEAGRVARDRPHGVDAPNRLERDPVRNGREELAWHREP